MTTPKTTTHILPAYPGFRALQRDADKGIVEGELVVAWEVTITEDKDGAVHRRAHPITAGETTDTEIPAVMEPDGRVTVFGSGAYPDLKTALELRAFGPLWF